MSEHQSCSRKHKRESTKDVLDTILARLNALEDRFVPPPPSSELLLQVPSTSLGHISQPPQILPTLTSDLNTDDTRDNDSAAGQQPASVSRGSISTGEDAVGRIA